MAKRKEKKQEKKTGKGRMIARIIGRFFAVIGVLLFSAAVLVVGAVTLICKGPSPSAADLFVNSVMETSAAKFVARIYFSPEEIDKICQRYSVVETPEVSKQDVEFVPPEETVEHADIEVFDVSGKTFKGKMMVVYDPSRVEVAGLEQYDGRPGKKIEEYYRDTGAVAAINAGGFYDAGGRGNGGYPDGIVIHNSRLLYGGLEEYSTVIGFDRNDHLVVGRMSGQQAMDRGLRDAVSFGPVLVVNGKPVEVTGTGGGLNPRTCIGQRADGAVLLLVLEGRSASSLGASIKDCVDLMVQYGAVNAGNLDGGSSTMMIWNGEYMNVSASLYGSRNLPSAVVVLPQKEERP